MNLKSSIIAFILTIVAVSILLYSIKDQPYLDLSDDYHYYSNIYRSKPYGIDMIRVVNEEDGVKYFISSKKEYFVRINGVDYQGVQEVEVGSNYEKQFDIIDHIEMYTKEPIAYFENDSLGFIALRGFIVWDYHEDGDITK